MQHSPSREANSSSASQEIPPFYGTPKVLSEFKICPLPVAINPVYASQSHFLKIHFNIILQSMSRSRHTNLKH